MANTYSKGSRMSRAPLPLILRTTEAFAGVRS